MEYIIPDKNMNQSLVSKLILLYVCFQFVECREYTDGPSFFNHSANSDVYNCSLKPAFEETVAELGQVINKDNRLIELEITIESNLSAANRSYTSSMQWLLPITDSGKGLLDLPKNYKIFSLGTLSYGIAQIHLHINQEPDECLENATSADVEKLLQHMVLSLTDTVDSRNKDRKDTIYICNGTITNPDNGYCCKLSADMINVTCEALQGDSMFDIMTWSLVVIVQLSALHIAALIATYVIYYTYYKKHTFSLNDASFYVQVAISKNRDTLKYRNKLEKVSVTPNCLRLFREKLLKCISDGPMDISKSKTFTFRLNSETLSCLVDNEHLQPEIIAVPTILTCLFSAVKFLFPSTSPDRFEAALSFLVILIISLPTIVLAPNTFLAIIYIFFTLISLIMTPLLIIYYHKEVLKPNKVNHEVFEVFGIAFWVLGLNVFNFMFYTQCLLLTMLGIILNYKKCFPYVILILMFFKFAFTFVNDARQNNHKLTIRIFKTIRELSVESQCDATNQDYILQENSGPDCFSRFAVCKNGTVSFLTSGLMVFNTLIQPENIYVKHIRKTFLNDVASLPGQLTPGSKMFRFFKSAAEIISVIVLLSVIAIFVLTFTKDDDISDLVVTFVTFVTGEASSKLITFWYRGKQLSSDEDDIFLKKLVRNYLTKHEEHLPIEESDYDLTCIGEQDESDPNKTCMIVENLDTEDEAWYVVPIKMSEEENLTGSQVEIV